MKLLLSLDIFSLSKKQLRELCSFYAQFLGSKQSNVDAVYVASLLENKLVYAYDIPTKDRLSGYPLRLLRALVRGAPLRIPPKNCHVVTCESTSVTKTVEAFSKKAEELEAELIALQTKAQKGFARLVLGSFTEALIHVAKRPLLITNPTAKLPKNISRILVADDLTGNRTAARKFCKNLAQQLDASVTLLHIDAPHSVRRQESTLDARRRLSQLESELGMVCKGFESAGISAQAKVEIGARGTSDIILKVAAREKADLIFVSARVGKLSALMGGSVTRKVVREATVPVLVFKG